MKATMLYIATVVLIGGAAYCISAEEDVAHGPVVIGCHLALSSLQPEFRHDQSVSVQLVLTNVGEEAVKRFHSDLLKMYRFEIMCPNGGAAPMTLEGKRQRMIAGFSASTHVLEPGKAVTYNVAALNRLYDMTLIGEYKIRAFHRQVWQPGKEDSPEIPSNQVTIRVVEKVADAKAPDAE